MRETKSGCNGRRAFSSQAVRGKLPSGNAWAGDLVSDSFLRTSWPFLNHIPPGTQASFFWRTETSETSLSWIWGKVSTLGTIWLTLAQPCTVGAASYVVVIPLSQVQAHGEGITLSPYLNSLCIYCKINIQYLFILPMARGLETLDTLQNSPSPFI